MSQAHDLLQSETSHELLQTEEGHVLEVTEASHVLEESRLVLPDQGYVTSNVVDYIITLTQAEYDAIPVPDPRAFYAIIG